MAGQDKKCKVLLVDDEKHILNSLKIYLELESYCVDTAGNGVEALEKMNSNKPAIVVLDIMMPEMDGFEVLRRMKADESLSDIPVILLTAKSQDSDAMAGYQLGASSYMTKPFNLDELVENIELIMNPEKN